MYVDWCYNQGFKAKLVGDDMELTEDHEVRQHICTYASFKKIWETNFNDLIIKKSSHDTCGTCFRFSNLLNGLRRREVDAGREVVREERLQLGGFNNNMHSSDSSCGSDSEAHPVPSNHSPDANGTL